MMRLNKLVFTCFVILLIVLVGCNKQKENKLVRTSEYIEPYAIITSDQYKTHLVDKYGIPYIMLSTEIRTDILMFADGLTPEEMEPYFALVKHTDLNTIELPIIWSDIEISQDQYRFDTIKTYLDLAKKYDLKVNLLWYGSLIDGETRTALIPQYIREDEKTYPIIQDLYDFGIFGRVKIYDWTNDNLLYREGLALYNVMNYVYEWNKNNDNYDPVVMVQIGQGADRFPRWRVNQYEVKDEDGLLLANEEAWNIVNTYLTEVAKGVKYAKYRALTRVEFTEQNAVVNYVRTIYQLDNIDIVAPTYLHSIANVKSGIRNFSDEFNDIPIINPENWANDHNHRSLLATFALGGVGYVAYPLSWAVYYPEPVNGALYNRININGNNLEEQFTQKGTRANDTKAITQGLTKAYIDVAKTKRGNFAVIGMDNRINVGDPQKIYTQSGVMFSYQSSEQSLGFVLVNDGYVYVYSTANGVITFSNVTFITATKGYYDKQGNWINEGSVSFIENNLGLEIEKETLYRIKIYAVNPLPTTIPTDYVNTVDSIRE